MHLRDLLPIGLLLAGAALIVAGVAVLFGAGWALTAAGASLVVLAVNEASS